LVLILVIFKYRLIQTVEVGKSYYSCEDMEGVALENDGRSRAKRYT